MSSVKCRPPKLNAHEVHIIDYFSWFFGSDESQETKTDPHQSTNKKGSRRYSISRKGGYSKNTKKQWKSQKETQSFSSKEIDDLQEIFEFFDIDNNKTMDLRKLGRAIRAFGLNPLEEEVEKIVSMMDVDGDQTIDFSEFCLIINHVKEVKGKYDKMRDAFRCLDLRKNGQVTTENLYLLLAEHSCDLSATEATELIRFADKTDSGFIDYEKFIQSMIAEENKMSASSEESEKSPNKTNNSTSCGTSCQGKAHSSMFQDSPSVGERVDTVWKAFGGPILINSAVIIKFSKSNKEEKKWPPLRKVLLR